MRAFKTIPALLSCLVVTLLIGMPGAYAEDKQGIFYGAKSTQYPAWFKESFLSFRDDIDEATAQGKRIMIVFHQDGCPYCNALIERNLSQKDIVDIIRKNFDVVAINMWGDREVASIDGKTYTEKSFAAALRIQFTPTLLFFDETGKTILRLNGYLPPRRFKVALNYVSGHNEKKISYRDYVAANIPRGKGGDLHKQDFFSAKPFNLDKVKGKPVAIFFEQKDCPNCDILHNKVLPDKEIREIIGKFHSIQVDMWSDTAITVQSGKKTTARELAKKLDVQFAPTMVLFNEAGEEIIRSEASFRLFHTKGIFAYVLDGGYKKQPSFQRWLTARAEHLIKAGKDIDLWRYYDEKPGERLKEKKK